MAGDLDPDDATTARHPTTMVTVCVFEDPECWDLEVLAPDTAPWAVEGLLREAWLRVKDRNAALRDTLTYDLDDEDDE